MLIKFIKNTKIFFAFSVYTSIIQAETYRYVISEINGLAIPGYFSSAREACTAAAKKIASSRLEYSSDKFYSITWQFPYQWYCTTTLHGAPIGRIGSSCPEGLVDNFIDGQCESYSESQVSKQKGFGDNSISCAPSFFKGDPINIAIGNSFQIENFYLSKSIDANFSLYYNSADGVWRHSYSARLFITDNELALQSSDGRVMLFARSANSAIAQSTELGYIAKTADGWIYTSPNEDTLEFNGSGQLIALKQPGGYKQYLSRKDGSVIVIDSFGYKFEFEFEFDEDSLFKVLALKSKENLISYSYDGFGRLAKVVKNPNGYSETRAYFYEDPRDPKLLTGITDERGIRYATWTYDDQGRAISSEHAGGAGKVTLTYNDDGSTTVTNELGKQTTYRFQVIQGIKRIVAIEGEPSANCPAANSTYTYNDRGQILTKTDAKGNVTQYAYNDRGLEISRTEGYGTVEARTVTTEWDASRFLPVKVVEAGRTITYTYDNQDRLLKRIIN